MDAIRSGGKGALVFLTLLVVTAITTIVMLVRLSEMEPPVVTVALTSDNLGASKEVPVTVTDRKRGVKKLTARLKQGDKDVTLLQKDYPRQAFFAKAGPETVEESFSIDLAKLGIRDGTADLSVTAVDYSLWNFFRGNVTTFNTTVTIDTKKPVITVEESPRYIKQGGAGLVVYRLSEPCLRHGATINKVFYPGVPIPNKGDNAYGALLALPYDSKGLAETSVIAEDFAGNEGRSTFNLVLKKVNYKFDKIQLTENFLTNKIPEFMQHYPNMPGNNDVERYLFVNNELRKQNNEKIREVCSQMTPERLWNGRFSRLPRSGPQAGFADTRAYIYGNQKIDEQVHLGVDLASLQHADVPAANRGRVAFADYLGIYGNIVILDHGQGLCSIYSHLNQIKADLGTTVEKDEIIGQTGTTGMAGGDHLHFGLLVNGIFVDPIEWWDDHWLKVNLFNFL